MDNQNSNPSEPAATNPTPQNEPVASPPQSPVTPTYTQSTPTPAPQSFQPSSSAQPLDQPGIVPVAVPLDHDPGHGLGIASIITSFLGLSVIGIILGFIAISKSKKSGRNGNMLGLIGVVAGFVTLLIGLLTLVLLGLSMNNFQGAQSKARDLQSISRVNAVHTGLEQYYNVYGSYPAELTNGKFTEYIGDSNSGTQALYTTSGTSSETAGSSLLMSGSGAQIVVIKGSKTESEASTQKAPDSTQPYQYIPFNCTGDSCKGYILRINIENPSSDDANPYTKRGLQN